MPTVGTMVYFLLIPNSFASDQKITVLSFVFVLTYLIPLFMLFFLKRIRLIKSYKLPTAKERKLPLLLMVFLFFFLGKSLQNISNLRDLSLLFFSTSLALLSLYILLYIKLKASIHLLSLGLATGFLMLLSYKYGQSFLLIIILHIFLAGLLGSARLKLNAHKPIEIYTGFFLGIIASFATYLVL